MRFGEDPKISGTLLISDGVLAGADIAGRENPYAEFVSVRPAATIDRGVYVYLGQFTLGTVAALEHIRMAGGLAKQHKVEDTIREARIALNLDPDNPKAHMILGDALAATGDAMAAQSEYAAALQSSELDPVFQKSLVDELYKKTKH
jgi:thioredoxin-like negative regulator of GroEL